MSEAANCLRCGSRLPEEEEGLCPTCGTPFGARTMAISVGADELKRAHETAQSQRAPAPELPVAGVGSAKSGGSLSVVIAVVAFLALLLSLVLWRLLAG